MAKKKIYLSPSSQTENKYIVGNTNEAAQCRKIAAALETALLRCGFDVLTGWGGDMYSRVKDSDRWDADLHIPIHTNAYNQKVQGTRIYCYDTVGAGYRAGKAIMAALAPITPGTSDSINPRKTLYEIRKPKAPTAYIEVGFHDNAQEAAWLVANTCQIGEAICKGICAFYQVAYIPEEKVRELYRVQVGAFENPDHARTMQEKLKAAGFQGFLVREEVRE